MSTLFPETPILRKRRGLTGTLLAVSVVLGSGATGGGFGCSTPVQTTNGPKVLADNLASPPLSLYDDAGETDEGAVFRGLFGVPLQNRATLLSTVTALYDPTSSVFRQYLTADEFLTRFGPDSKRVVSAQSWLESRGFTVPRVSANRMLMEFTGTISQFNSAFHTTVHTFNKKDAADARTQTTTLLYAPNSTLVLPADIQSSTLGVLTIDPDVDATPLTPETMTVLGMPETITQGLTPQQVAKAYGYDQLAMQGGDGSGTAIGLVVGDAFKTSDARAMWTNFGVTRADPVIKTVMEPPATRVVETSLDVEWAGALAPKAALIVYEAPDVRDTSILYTFNEAIASDEVSVISDSFGHRETSVTAAVAQQYDDSALMAAALGITVVAATGDSNGVDVPSVCPHVTAVGGTSLSISGDDIGETAWSKTGAGTSKYFKAPSWQSTTAVNAPGRGVADVALNAETKYWVVHLGAYDRRGGTSFSSPVFAAMIAAVNSARSAKGKPPIGFLNTLLYSDTDLQGTFRDVVIGASDTLSAEAGWDFASGWGSPNAVGLAQKIP